MQENGEKKLSKRSLNNNFFCDKPKHIEFIIIDGIENQ